jgi:hypothetical protein
LSAVECYAISFLILASMGALILWDRHEWKKVQREDKHE